MQFSRHVMSFAIADPSMPKFRPYMQTQLTSGVRIVVATYARQVGVTMPCKKTSNIFRLVRNEHKLSRWSAGSLILSYVASACSPDRLHRHIDTCMLHTIFILAPRWLQSWHQIHKHLNKGKEGASSLYCIEAWCWPVYISRAIW